MGATLAFNGLKEMKTGVPEVKRKKNGTDVQMYSIE